MTWKIPWMFIYFVCNFWYRNKTLLQFMKNYEYTSLKHKYHCAVNYDKNWSVHIIFLESQCVTYWPWKRFRLYSVSDRLMNKYRALIEWCHTCKHRNTNRKNFPSANFSIKNDTRTDLGSNPCFGGEGSLTNHLNHGTASGKTKNVGHA